MSNTKIHNGILNINSDLLCKITTAVPECEVRGYKTTTLICRPDCISSLLKFDGLSVIGVIINYFILMTLKKRLIRPLIHNRG